MLDLGFCLMIIVETAWKRLQAFWERQVQPVSFYAPCALLLPVTHKCTDSPTQGLKTTYATDEAASTVVK